MGELALIGRAAETEIIDRLLGDAFSGRSGVLVLTGEAGVGKSALLAYARARADGMGVLQTAGGSACGHEHAWPTKSRS